MTAAERQKSDLRLVELAKRWPDCGAFEIIINRYKGYIYKAIFHMHNAATVLEVDELSVILKEKIWWAIERYDVKKGATFSTWLVSSIERADIFNTFKAFYASPIQTSGRPGVRPAIICEDMNYLEGEEYLSRPDNTGVVFEWQEIDRAFKRMGTDRQKDYFKKVLEGYTDTEISSGWGTSCNRAKQVSYDVLRRLEGFSE